MTDDAKKDGAEAASAAQAPQDPATREKNIEQFEKIFRRMDSAFEGEAITSFKMARNMLPKIDMTFASILEMLGNGQDSGKAAELQELVEQYKEANDNLKIAESVLLEENSRLNLLLRHFRDAKAQSSGLNIESFKEAIRQRLDAMTDAHEQLKDLQLPQNAEDLENLYKMRVGEGLALQEGLGSEGVWQRFLLWSLKSTSKTDLSDTGVVKLQELVRVQEDKITEASTLLEHIVDLRLQGQDIAEKLSLIVSESAPKALYDEAMEKLKNLQLLVGEGKDIKTLQDKNKELQQENESLVKRVNDLVAELLAQPDLKPAGEVAPQAPKQGTATHIVKNAEEQLRLKDQEIADLRARLTQVTAATLLSTDDLKLVVTLEQSLPVLTQAGDALAVAVDKLTDAQKTQKSRFNRMFFGKNRKEKKVVDQAREELQTLVTQVKDTATLARKLTDAFNANADKRQKELIDQLTAAEAKTAKTQDDYYAKAKADFEKEFKAIETTYTGKLTELQKNIGVAEKTLEERQKFEQECLAEAMKAVKSAATTEAAREAQKALAEHYLFVALAAKDPVKIDFCLKKGASINALNAEYQTPLMVAALTGDVAFVDLILSKAPDLFVRVTKFRNQTVFNAVEGSNHQAALKATLLAKLLEHLPDMPMEVPAQNTHEAECRQAAGRVLLDAMTRMDAVAVGLCLTKGANINAQNADGATPLMLAVANQNIPMIQTLLNNGADLHIKNNKGGTVFDVWNAITNNAANRAQIGTLLVQAIPNAVPPQPNIGTDEGRREILNRILFDAILYEDTKRIDLCLEKGADINVIDANGWTPLMHAIYHRQCLNLTDFILLKKPDLLVKNPKHNKNVFELLDDVSLKINGEKENADYYGKARVSLKQKLLAAMPKVAPKKQTPAA